MIKFTDPSFQDYEGLQNALSLVKEVAGHVNSAHAQVDNAMFAWCCRFGEDFEVQFISFHFLLLFVVLILNQRN